MDTLLHDIRYGMRMLVKSPVVTIVAAITLALGIGANTAIFTVVNAVLLRQMPFPRANQLMNVYHSYPAINLPVASVDAGSWDYYHKNIKSFSSMAAFTGWRVPQNLTGIGNPEHVRSVGVTGDFFRVLGVKAMLGRTLTSQDTNSGAGRQVVLGHGIWKERFASDPAIVGKNVALDGMNYTVVGVMPSGFEYPSTAQLWLPLTFTPKELEGGPEYLSVIGRLADGVAPKQAVAEFEKVTAEVRRQYPQVNILIKTMPLQKMEVMDFSKPLWVLLGAVTLVLLIACVNIANLLLARATTRQKELTIRAALGASRLRITRQLLTEGVLLALIGGALGLYLGYLGTDFLLAIAPMQLPSFVHVTPDLTVLLFTAAVSIISGLLFGIVPALHASVVEVGEALKEGGRSSSTGRHFTRRILVTGEIALAMVLLVAAGLMIKSFVRILEADPGFSTSHTLTAKITLPAAKYSDEARVSAVYKELGERLATVPGITASGLSSAIPMSGESSSTFFIRGKEFKPNPHAYTALSDAGFLRASGIPLRQGRFIAQTDQADSPPVAVIDENAARMYFPGENPVGQKLAMGYEGSREKPLWREIVGVVGSVRHRSPVGVETKGQVYLPYAQTRVQRNMQIVVKTEGDPTRFASAIREQLRQIDSELPLSQVRTMDSLFEEFVALPKFNMMLLAVFAGLALLLAAVGIYAVMSYSVSQLTHEIGVRMALGARQRDVLNMVMGQAAKLATFGLVIGIVGALIATRVLQTLLFGVSADDLGTFAVIGFLLASVALLASFVPALRATRVDPMVALRYE